MKDSVVLSKKEYDDLIESKRQLGCYIEDQKILLQRINSHDPFWFCSIGGCEGVCKECIDTCEMSILVKEREKIVKKIWYIAKEVVERTKFMVNNRKYLHLDALKEIIKSCGVEIKEDTNGQNK